MEASRLLVVGICVWASCLQVAEAWNRAGHMVSASLAYCEMKQSHPEKLEQCLALLKQHPHFTEHWAPILDATPDEHRDTALLMLAARWPDDVRDQPFKGRHHRRVWHFADYALKFPGTPPGVPDGIIHGRRQPGDKDEGYRDLLDALSHNLTVLRGDADEPTKAIALCWVLHLVGDMHQPLHMVSRFSDLFPDGDKGGNGMFIRIPPNRSSINLHSFWDGLILRGVKGDSLGKAKPETMVLSLRTASRRATLLFNQEGLHRSDFSQLANPDLGAWAKESVELARKWAYLDGQLTGPNSVNPFVVPEGYTMDAQAVAEKQLALAGHRLADLLSQ